MNKSSRSLKELFFAMVQRASERSHAPVGPVDPVVPNLSTDGANFGTTGAWHLHQLSMTKGLKGLMIA